MTKIAYASKVTALTNTLPEINKVTSDNMNEVKASVNALYDDVGWVKYTDSVNTVSNKQTLTASQENIITIVDSSPIISEKPVAIGDHELFLLNKIRPFASGDAYVIRIDFESEINNANGHFDAKIDVGGGIGYILKRAEIFPKGSNTAQPFSTTDYIYVLDTFILNGGTILINPSHTMLIWNKAISIHRVYGAR